MSRHNRFLDAVHAAQRRARRRAERILKRRLTKGEVSVLNARVLREMRKAEIERKREAAAFYTSRVNKALGRAPAARPVVHIPKTLQAGISPRASTGSSGLGGSLRRRIHRAGPRQFRLHKPTWIDPYPWIPGTRPEKRIFQALVERRVYFIFQAEWSDVDDGSGDLPILYQPLFKPDFVIPEYKVVIDPYSEFHHSLPGAIKRDTQKVELYFLLGWHYYTPWAHEVEDRGGFGIVDDVQEFKQPPVASLKKEKDIRAKAEVGYRIGPNLGAGAFSVGIANRKRRRAPALGIRRRRR